MSKSKLCCDCGKMLSISSFWKNKTSLDGLCFDCKVCNYKRCIKYRHNNPDKIKQIAKAYRLRNVQKHRNLAKAWRINNPEKAKLLGIKFRMLNKKKVKEYALKHKLNKYGINNIIFTRLKKLQKDKCCICKKKFNYKGDCCIDHNHSSKKVRGLLCFTCNAGIGLFKEDKKILFNAMSYIKKHGKKAG